MPIKQKTLRVFDSNPSHVGRNIITLDRQTKEELEVSSGDIIEIEGTKKTAAVVWPAKSEDEGKNIIRMDHYIRYNCGVGLGDNVIVRKANVLEAKEVVLAPTQEVRIIAPGYNRILKKSFLGRPLTKGDSIMISVFGSGFVYRVVDTKPKGIIKVTDFTNFILKEKPVKGELDSIPNIAYEDIGGLKEQIQKVREMVELPMRHPELFRKLGIIPPKGILLYGPPGTGKTLLAKAVAHETNAHFISVNAPQIMSKFVGEAEERVRQLFKEAEDNAPSIIFIDEIDSIAPKRDEVIGEVERRVVAQLLALMDGLEARGDVIVMAATNRINSLDNALRRPGRFDREIEFGVPNIKGREEILQIHTRGMPLVKKQKNNKIKDKKEAEKIVDLKKFAEITHGFVGADLEALSKEAAMKALRRYLPEINLEAETIPTEVLEKLEVRKNDFIEALNDVQPSALREISIQIPKVKWNDIGGLEEAKKELKQAVEWPLKHANSFKEMGINPPKGILLYGPPGCGKTLLAKAVANESQANFISVKGPELLSMFVGESEKAIRKIFRKARQVSPAIIFFDEIDSIASKRGFTIDSGVTSRVLDQLLTELDGITQMKKVIFIAATNRPDLIDQALLRAGRIDKFVNIESPDEKSRLKILQVHTQKVPLSKTVNLKEIAKKTDGFSGADLEALVREAALLVLDENKLKPKEITNKEFERMIEKIKGSITPKVKKAYNDFEKHYNEFVPAYVG